MDSITLLYAIFILLASTFTVIMAIKAFLTKDLISHLKTSKFRKDKLYQHKSGTIAFMKTILLAYIVTALYFTLIPGIMDLPRIFTGNFEIDICTVQESYEYKKDLWVHLMTDDGEKLNLMVLDSSYKQGEKYLVYYLPNMKYGTLVAVQ
jgi:hypothetical protein